MEALVGNTIERILADKGYRGHNAPPDYKFKVFISGQKRTKDLVHLPIGQVPGVSQGAGVGSVLAVASIEIGPSTPFTTAETRQR